MRNSAQDFELANPIYSGGTVTFYTVSGGLKTTIKATLYKYNTGTETLANPQKLDEDGMFVQPVYFEEPVIAVVGGLTIPEHTTGIIPVSFTYAVASEIHGAATKNVPVAADEFSFWDSVTATLKKIAWSVFHTLFSSGTVRLVYENGAWTLHAADGSIVSTAGTTTNGLQEAVNLACTDIGTTGYDLEVIGGDLSTGGSIGLTIQNTVQFPPMQGKCIRIGAVDIDANSGFWPNIQFDSCMMVNFFAEGAQFPNSFSSGDSFNVLFKPTVKCPLDNVIGIVDSHFHMGSCGNVKLDISHPSGITNSTFICGENQGGDVRNVGFQVTQGVEGSNFTGNTFRLKHIHGFLQTGLQVGTGVTAAAGNIFGGNVWDIAVIADTVGVDNQLGIDTHATGDIYIGKVRIGAAGTNTIGRTTSAKNKFLINYDSIRTIHDYSTTQDNEGIFGFWKNRCHVTLTSNQTGIVTATPTKILFNTLVFDTGPSTSFDSVTNHRWSATRSGFIRVSARCEWVGAGDNTPLTISIYKNGSEFLRNTINAAGTGGNQGPEVSGLMNILNGEYIEVFVTQSSGGNQDVLAGVGTWFQCEYVDG